jgi:hypothetical protein
VQSDIFKPTKYGGKYTVTLIPGMPSSQSSPILREDLVIARYNHRKY